jgi:hypothetical protein
MEEAPENGKELSHSAHAVGMDIYKLITIYNHVVSCNIPVILVTV